MTEEEYIKVTNLTGLENARSCLRSVLPAEEYAVDRRLMMDINAKLNEMIFRLYRSLDGKVVEE